MSPGWARGIDRVRWLGPGLVMAATAIGASHLVLAPTAGAAFGYALLWAIPFSHLFKYPAFDFGPRFAVATGETLLEGYARVPGPRGWALWAFLVGTLVQGVTVLAGVLGVAAAVAAAALPGLPLPAWSLLLGLVIAALLLAGGFDALSGISKWMLLLLAVMTAVAFAGRPPSPGFWPGLVRPGVPEGSIVLLGALLGWMPTGIDVAVWHSMWALERRGAWAERARRRRRVKRTAAPEARGGAVPDEAPAGEPPAGRILAVARIDLGIGYGLSLALGVMFVALGAEVLRPAGVVPEGADVAITLARLYTDVLGPWMLPLFLGAAFAGMFSTAYGVLDGFPRAFSRTVRLLRGGGRRPAGAPRGRRRASGGRLYTGFLVGSLALAILETILLPDPVVLVTTAAVASFILSPITYGLNHYCVTRLVGDRDLRPGRALRAWSLVGFACMTAAAVFAVAAMLG